MMNHENDKPAPGTLGAILAKTSVGMLSKLDLIREGLSHAGEKGNATQDAVADFLNERLPLSLRATTGQVMDQTGRKSAQVDVILYDATTTPMLFASSPLGGRHTVPAEGVLAVIEVKTRLTPSELSQSIDHAQTVKTLQRDAYLPGPLPISFDVYGRNWSPLPPIAYSVFAFEGDGLYADLLNEPPHYALAPENRIDNLVVLSRGVCVAGEMTVTDSAGNMNPATRFLPSPTPLSIMVDCKTSNALAVWYGLVLGNLAQFVGMAKIDITRYLQAELSLSGEFSQTTAAGRDQRARAERQTADFMGLPHDLLRRFGAGEALTFPEVYDLVTNPHAVDVGPPPGTDGAATIGHLIRAAQTMSKDDWLAYVARSTTPDTDDTTE